MSFSELYYDRNGQVIDFDTWGRDFGDMTKKRVAVDYIGDVRISTVWLGLDHQFGEGPPLIFETMIFGGPHDQWCDRYSTEAEAHAGHQRVLAALHEGRDP